MEKALVGYGVERREALRIKLTFEEILLEYQKNLGEETAFQVRCSNRFSAIQVEITVPGARFEPMDKAEDDTTVMRELLTGLALHLPGATGRARTALCFSPRKIPCPARSKWWARLSLLS